MFDSGLPALIVLSSLVSGLSIFFLNEQAVRTRTVLNLAGAGATFALVMVMLWGVFNERVYETRLFVLPELELVLRADPLSVMFAVLSAGLWFITTIYAIGYLEGTPKRSRFFGFFSLCVGATLGVSLAGNMITFLLFYEVLTLSTYPLVVHRGSAQAIAAGRTYLTYTVIGGAVLLLGVVWLRVLVGPLDFTEARLMANYIDAYRVELVIIFALLIAGLGVKAALLPLHGWLPLAMVAPAPVSALLHAVAVVKSGAFGIVRVVYDVYGLGQIDELGVGVPLAMLAGATIIYGSVRALYQDDLKRRLAFSTVSQVSYIALGVAIVGPIASIGGIVHLVHQGVMKITLFFAAGNLAETLGIHKVSEMKGVGRRMPLTMTAFTLGALGMIGMPPMAGFITKWYLGWGALTAGQPWVIGILVLSTLLNAAYFLPILYTVWFERQSGPWPEEHHFGRLETHWMLLGPVIVTATLAVLLGLLASVPFSPLDWVSLIVERKYSR